MGSYRKRRPPQCTRCGRVLREDEAQTCRECHLKLARKRHCCPDPTLGQERPTRALPPRVLLQYD